MANAAVGAPEARTPVAVPSAIDGKPATATHFSLKPNSSKAVPIAPVTIPTDVQMGKPVTAVQAKKPGGEKAVVTYVQDGDGVKLKRKDGSELVCRIDTIDAPETAKSWKGQPNQAFGPEAKRTLQQMIQNKEVTVRITKPASEGKYNRNYCEIEIEGEGVDLKMIQAGAAWLYRRYSDDPKLDAAETRARKQRKGLWKNPNPENPEDFRSRYELD